MSNTLSDMLQTYKEACDELDYLQDVLKNNLRSFKK